LAETDDSLLAKALFEVGGVTEIVFHESVVSASRDPAIDEEWKAMAREIGERIRAHLLSGLEIVSPDFFGRIPPEQQMIARVQKVIDDEINPRLSGHSGYVRLERIKNNTIWINMGGSCQGCAEAPITFRHDVGAVLRRAIPALGAIYDATDHLAGVNPYFQSRSGLEGQNHEAA
jgi:Fe-S cluster biogenesis protein NfuA